MVSSSKITDPLAWIYYAMPVKLKGESLEAEKRYSPGSLHRRPQDQDRGRA
jgi:hypothetical protein